MQRVLPISRFQAHAIHAVSGDPTFSDLQHKGIRVFKSHENTNTLSERFLEHIADVREIKGMFQHYHLQVIT